MRTLTTVNASRVFPDEIDVDINEVEAWVSKEFSDLANAMSKQGAKMTFEVFGGLGNTAFIAFEVEDFKGKNWKKVLTRNLKLKGFHYIH